MVAFGFGRIGVVFDFMKSRQMMKRTASRPRDKSIKFLYAYGGAIIVIIALAALLS
jgi:hypothetical protein